MTTWRVLKRDERGYEDEIDDSKHWIEVGSHDSDASYWLGPNAAQVIGERFGAGEYLLFSEDNRANSLRVGERSEFYAIEDEPEPENVNAPVALKVALSAEEVMSRDG